MTHSKFACRHSGPQGQIEPFTIVDDPSAWVAADYRGNEDAFIYRLTKQDLKEVAAAVAAVEANGLRIEVRNRRVLAPCSRMTHI